MQQPASDLLDSTHAYCLERRARRFALTAIALLSFVVPSAAHASPDSLRMAIEDLVFGPVDMAASPVTGGIATADNLDAVSDQPVLQGLYAPFGWAGLTCLQLGQGLLRTLTGVVELVPAIVLFPFADTDLPEDFNPFSEGDPLLEAENPLAKNPAWLPWVPLTTPVTIDARVAPISPWARYLEDPGPDAEEMEASETAGGMARAR